MTEPWVVTTEGISVSLGAELEPVVRVWDLDLFRQRHELVYGPGRIVEDAWPEQNIHADPDAARREGLPDPVGSAPQVIAMVHKIMHRTFGMGWLAGGHIRVKMVRPFYPGDRTTARARVVGLALEDDGSNNERTRVSCRTAVLKEDGTVVLVGTASAVIPT